MANRMRAAFGDRSRSAQRVAAARVEVPHNFLFVFSRRARRAACIVRLTIERTSWRASCTEFAASGRDAREPHTSLFKSAAREKICAVQRYAVEVYLK
jgi:hypothetical protein